MPTKLTFASTTVGSTTAAQVVTIKNSGTATLNLTSETITGTNATSFLKSASTCGTTLAAAGTCTVSVEFKPAVAGALSASLSIADNATGSPQAVMLTGTGTASAPAVSLTPASIALPASIVGTTFTAQLVTLKNTGTATLTMSSIEPILNRSWRLAAAELRWPQVDRAHSMTPSNRFRPPRSRQR
jgi:hypothetical protein